jgi:hypothetical protein
MNAMWSIVQLELRLCELLHATGGGAPRGRGRLPSDALDSTARRIPALTVPQWHGRRHNRRVGQRSPQLESGAGRLSFLGGGARWGVVVGFRQRRARLITARGLSPEGLAVQRRNHVARPLHGGTTRWCNALYLRRCTLAPLGRQSTLHAVARPLHARCTGRVVVLAVTTYLAFLASPPQNRRAL